MFLGYAQFFTLTPEIVELPEEVKAADNRWFNNTIQES